MTDSHWKPHNEATLIPYQALSTLPVASILVLAPHPDDEVFGCGGLLALAASQGVACRVVVVSDGGQGGDAAQRVVECRAAAHLLGYRRSESDLQFWGLPDRGVAPDAALVARIVAELQACKPDWLLAPSPLEVHPDHVAVCRAALQAAGQQGVQLGFYEVGQPLLPNRFVDITAVASRKRAAMACFPSQLAQQRYDRQITALNQYRAYTLGAAVTQAEAYWFPDADSVREPSRLLDTLRGLVGHRLALAEGTSWTSSD